MRFPKCLVLVALAVFIFGCVVPPSGTNLTNASGAPAKANISCAENLWNVSNGSLNRFNSSMFCRDDCARVSPTASCDPKTCLCKTESRTCTNNSFLAAAGGFNSFNAASMICRDDCSILGPDFSCDGRCLCQKKPGAKENVSCVNNSVSVGITGHNPFNSSSMLCRDDCARMGANLVCTGNCTCAPVIPPKKEVDCAVNTMASLVGLSIFGPGWMCRDNCAAAMGAAYKCDAASCTCVKPPPPNKVSCAGNSMQFGLFPNTFNPATMKCEDDCDAILWGDYVCDPKTCTCEEEPVSCAGNSLNSFFGGFNGFNPATMSCRDDCAKSGEEFYCDASECVCKKITENASLSCASNTGVDIDKIGDIAAPPGSGTYPYSKLPAGVACRDDCAEAGAGMFYCDPVSCYCKPHENLVSCAKNTLAPNYPKEEISPFSISRCQDDCKSLNPTYVCDPQGCFCRQNRTVTPRCGDGYVSSPGVPGGGFEECDVGFGFYQPKDAAGNPINTPDTCPPPTKCDAQSCKCVQPVTEAFCGDGVITSPIESCDVGSAATNKCAAGSYCNQCQCVKLETSPRCGDGKISVESGEQCDGGSVTTNLCPSGYKCFTPECACVPLEGSSQCGDGTVVAPEECDHGNSFTAQCPAGKSCYSCECVDYEDLTHTECDFGHFTCEIVQGPGQNECSSNADCEMNEDQPLCGNGEREGSEECDGNDDSACGSNDVCNQNCQCQSSTTIAFHFECVQNACVQVQGSGSSQCNSDDDCVPPVVDCPAYCEGAGYGQSLGGGYSSAQACQSAVEESAQQCTTKCVYSKFYSVSNQAGTTTCCCKEVKTFSCSDCPGQNPQCPDPNVVCPANQP